MRKKMRNRNIRQEVKVAELREKIRESRLRWYACREKKRTSLPDGQRNAWRRGQGREGDRESNGWIVFEMMTEDSGERCRDDPATVEGMEWMMMMTLTSFFPKS